MTATVRVIAREAASLARVRQEGEAVYARLEMDAAVLVAAGKSFKSMTSNVVAGGRFELYSNYLLTIQAVAASTTLMA